MNSVREIGAYVVEAAGLDIVVHVEKVEIRSVLVAHGFTIQAANVLKKTVSNSVEKAKIFCLLRDMGVAFSAGPGWSPSEVFEELRDRELLDGVYQRISWVAPGEWQIESNC
ncbi:hypothetical protein BV497_13965 [Fulvimonas soli]|jgi:hypothetical protein|nr:hypothetical protein BV497_13965 [Fulvimonas soli]